jgi:hypothetical protein
MEIPRHWRLKKQRYGLIGDYEPSSNSIAFPPGPNTLRYPLNGNGHGVENPFIQNIIYQAPKVELIKSE